MTTPQLPVRRSQQADITWITDRIATGADLWPSEPFRRAQLSDWVAQGVTHVVDCRQEFSDEGYVGEWAPTIRYSHNGIDDRHGYEPPQAAFDHVVAFAREALCDPVAKVLVHCHMGINRGPSMALAVLLDQHPELLPVEAFELLRVRRPFVGLAYARDAVLAHLVRTEGDAAVLGSFLRHESLVMDHHAVMSVSRAIHGLRQQEWAL